MPLDTEKQDDDKTAIEKFMQMLEGNVSTRDHMPGDEPKPEMMNAIPTPGGPVPAPVPLEDKGKKIPKPQNMAGGGYVMNEDDPELMTGPLSPGSSTQTPMALPQAPMGAPSVPNMPAAPPMPPATVPPPGAPPVSTPKTPQIPGFPAGDDGSGLMKYLSGMKGKFDKYGPDSMMKMQDNINKRRDSLRYRGTAGAKGFADALMMGVAGAGNPGFEQGFRDDQRALEESNKENLQNARKAQMENVQMEMSMDQMSPDSPLSKVAQSSFGPLFAKLGYDPSMIRGMSAANMESALALMSQYGGKEIEAILRGQEMQLAMQQYLEAKRHNEEVERLQGVGQTQSAAEEVLDQSSIFNPFRWKQRAEAKDIISGIAGGNEGTNTLGEAMDQLSSMDKQALEWARSNANDPRAAKIMERLGMGQ